MNFISKTKNQRDFARNTGRQLAIIKAYLPDCLAAIFNYIKKTAIISIIAVLVCSALTACSENNPGSENTSSTSSAVSQTKPDLLDEDKNKDNELLDIVKKYIKDNKELEQKIVKSIQSLSYAKDKAVTDIKAANNAKSIVKKNDGYLVTIKYSFKLKKKDEAYANYYGYGIVSIQTDSKNNASIANFNAPKVKKYNATQKSTEANKQ